VPERVPIASAADERREQRDELAALSMLIVAVPPRHPNHARAMAFNDALEPCRETARRALSVPGADYGAAIAACWTLLDEAAPEFDGSGFFIRGGMTTRRWARQRVQYAKAAARRYRRHT
jgi:hypothetical protein